MKKCLVILITLAALLSAIVLPGSTALAATAMPLDGSWIVLDQNMAVGDYFSGGPWEWDEPYLVRFTITDVAVVSDQFEVYDNGELVLTTPAMPDWDDLGLAGPFTSPPHTGDPDVALADGRFSSGVIYLGPGAHSITIRDIHIPPQVTGEPFPDGTVAFKAEPLVEFTKEITDSIPGGDGDGVVEVGEDDWVWELTITLTNISGETIHVGKVHDRLGGDMELLDWAYDAELGLPVIHTKGKTEKVFIDFPGDFDLSAGEDVSFMLLVSPDMNTGNGNGKNEKFPRGHQEFTSAGEHCLNSGAWFEGWIGDEYIEASTLPVCVDVEEFVDTPPAG